MTNIDIDVHSYLFARWITTVYSNGELNKNSGVWWAEKLDFFNQVILPGYHRSGVVTYTEDHLVAFNKRQ